MFAPPQAWLVSTHSRLKAAERTQILAQIDKAVSTHSRLKAADPPQYAPAQYQGVSTHSRLKAAELPTQTFDNVIMFQHTAA